MAEGHEPIPVGNVDFGPSLTWKSGINHNFTGYNTVIKNNATKTVTCNFYFVIDANITADTAVITAGLPTPLQNVLFWTIMQPVGGTARTPVVSFININGQLVVREAIGSNNVITGCVTYICE